eukprot:5514478-Amphidinium_carterae.1
MSDRQAKQSKNCDNAMNGQAQKDRRFEMWLALTQLQFLVFRDSQTLVTTCLTLLCGEPWSRRQ